MSFKLICGSFGSGKTRRAVAAFLDALGRGAGPVFIAPSEPDARHFHREILRTAGGGVITGGRVTTFDGLCRELEQATGAAAGTGTLSPGGRQMLLRAVVDGAARPDLLQESARYDGFVKQLGTLIAEFKDLGVMPSRLGRELKEWAGRDPWRQGFNRELYRLFEEYETALKELGIQDSESARRCVLGALISDPALLARRAVVVDGFYDFTPFEVELISAVFRTGAELLITLPFEPGQTALRAPGRFFELLKQEAEVEQLPPRSAGADATRHIAANLFQEDFHQIDAGREVAILKAAGARGQAELVAAEILRLWREEGFALDDIAIVTRGQGEGSLALAAALSDFGVPCDMPVAASLAGTAVGLTALAALELAAGGGQDTFFSFLRSPLMAADQDLVDRFEQGVRRRGVTGRPRLLGGWRATPGAGASAAAIEELEEAAEKGAAALATVLKDLILRLAQAGSRHASLEELEEDAAAAGGLAAICDDAVALEEKLGSSWRPAGGGGGSEKQSADAVTASLLAGAIRSATLRLPGSMRGCVRLLDPHRVLNQSFDAIFLCGLLEGEFPRLSPENSFLADTDRQWLNQRAGLSLETREYALDKERFLYYRTLTRARKRIYLSYPYCDREGKPTVPSLFLEDTLALFNPGSWDEFSREKGIGELAFHPDEAPTPDQGLLSLALMNSRTGGRSLPATFRKAATPAGIDARLAAVAVASGFTWPRLGDEVKEGLASREHFKVTELEQYLRCPFRYFIEQLVKPEQMEQDPLALDRGNTVHKILAQFINLLKSANVILSRADEGQIGEARRIMGELIEKLLPGADDLLSHITRIDITFHLHRFIDREKSHRPGFEPYETEWTFGICDGKPEGRYDEETMLRFGDIKVCGRIDRVDILRGTNKAIVIDYKASKDSNLPQPSKFEEMGVIQLPLYMLAVRDIWGLDPVGGEYYGIVGERRRGIFLEENGAEIMQESSPELYPDSFVSRDRQDRYLQTAARQAEEAAAGIRAGAFDCVARDPSFCKRCRWSLVCRHENRPLDPAGAGQR